MNSLVAQPDITLHLDRAGVIRSAQLGNGLRDESIADWIGLDWCATVADGECEQLTRLLDALRAGDLAASAPVNLRLPSGRLLPIEYTAVCLGGGDGLIAVGRQSPVVADLRRRLLDAQRTMERDYWKLRAVETRYRLLFDAARDAVVSLDAATLCILEVNPSAADLLGLPSREPAAGRGADLRDWFANAARGPFERLVERVREHGSAPGLMLRLRDEGPDCLVRVSRIGAATDALLMVQMALTGSALPPLRPALDPRQADLIERCPDGYVVLDRGGRVRRANAAFVEMTQAGSEAALIGESLGRWLERPGADLSVLLASVQRFGSVRLFATGIRGQLDSVVEVELSATGNRDRDPDLIGVSVRAVGRRLHQRDPGEVPETVTAAFAGRIGKTPLKTLVDEAVTEVERHFVTQALTMTGGNRTAAAQLLGLSRQSLHTKLNRLGLNGAAPASGPEAPSPPA